MHKPNIVFVHGAGGGGWEWRLWERIFDARGWTISAPDLQPDGAGIRSTSIDDYLAQIEGWLNTEGPPPFVVGASMGGILAAQAVATTPVSGLILVNSLPPLGVAGWPLAPMRFPAVITWPQLRVRESLRDLPDYDPAFAELFGETWREESGVVMNALYRGVPVAAPDVPCLVISGAADEDVPRFVAEALAHTFNADFLSLARVSHLGILLGQRAQFAAAMAVEWIECMWVEREGTGAFATI